MSLWDEGIQLSVIRVVACMGSQQCACSILPIEHKREHVTTRVVDISCHELKRCLEFEESLKRKALSSTENNDKRNTAYVTNNKRTKRSARFLLTSKNRPQIQNDSGSSTVSEVATRGSWKRWLAGPPHKWRI
ncbi:hypothetical protein BC938DRAFT_476367 [Jimgerdemannia flammicorona]|uniref:Uncharacterized protein n=1 Tax=Jimgerdemannia flammicorona TaxID=994334 RepID=A0A433QQL6_9FUNG|nr:hypothetical protein BC938DRAFT_476367 [Jimgerdemannia flammicorona]